MASWTRCTSFLATGAATGGAGYAAGPRLLRAARRDLEAGRELGRESDVAGCGAAFWSVCGALHLREAILSARLTRPGDAWDHIAIARGFVQRGASDHNPAYQLTCGPTNAWIVEVAVAVELGEGGEAIRRAQGLRIPHGFPPVRASHHFIDLARAYLWEGQRRRALEALLRAERYAPQQTRHHPMTHETLGVLVQLERSRPDGLLGLVQRIGQAGVRLDSTL